MDEALSFLKRVDGPWFLQLSFIHGRARTVTRPARLPGRLQRSGEVQADARVRGHGDRPALALGATGHVARHDRHRARRQRDAWPSRRRTPLGDEGQVDGPQGRDTRTADCGRSRNREELYDLELDPLEESNLIGLPGYDAVYAKRRALLDGLGV